MIEKLTAAEIRAIRNPSTYEQLVGYANAPEVGYIYCIRHGIAPDGKRCGPDGQEVPAFSEKVDWIDPRHVRRIIGKGLPREKSVAVFRSVEFAAELFRLGFKKVVVVTSVPCPVTSKLATLLGYDHVVAGDEMVRADVNFGDWRPADLSAPLRIRTLEVMPTRSKKGRMIKTIKGLTEHGAWVRSYVDGQYRNAPQWSKITNSRHRFWSFSHAGRLEKYPSILNADYPPLEIRKCKETR